MTHCIVEIILKLQANNNVILLQSYIASSLHRLPYFRTLGMALKFGSIIQVFRINILYESDIIIDLTKLKASVPLMCMYCTSTSTSKYSTHTLHGYQLLPLYHCCQILIVQYTRLGRHTIMPRLHNPFFGQQTFILYQYIHIHVNNIWWRDKSYHHHETKQNRAANQVVACWYVYRRSWAAF